MSTRSLPFCAPAFLAYALAFALLVCAVRAQEPGAEPIPTTVEPTEAPAALLVPIGLDATEDPAGFHLRDADQVLVTTSSVLRRDAAGAPRSALLRAVDPDGVTGSVTVHAGPPPVTWSGLPEALAELGGAVENGMLPLVVESIDGRTEGHLFGQISSLEQSPVVWTATGHRSMAQHGGLAWQARAWVGLPVLELDLLWNLADALDPDPLLRGVTATLAVPPGWHVVTPWAYPGLRIEPGRIVLGEGETLPMMRTKSWRLILAPPVEGALAAAQGVAAVSGFGVPVPGMPRSLTAKDGPYLPLVAHDEPMPTLEHLGGRAAAYARARAAWDGWSAAVAAGDPLPDDPERNTLPARHGWIYSWGARTGGPTGGLGIEARPHLDLALAGSPDAIRALRLHQWTTEGRGLGILFDGGRLLSLPELGEPAPEHWPSDLRAWLAVGTLGPTNYELDRSAGEAGAHARGWLSKNGDPFGMRSVTKRASGDEGAAAYEAALLGLAPYDRQHGILAMRDRIPLAALTGDWLATTELRGLADAYRWAAFEGQGGSARMGNLARSAEATLGMGWPTGRDTGWSLRCVAEAYSLTPPGERGRWRGWLETAARGAVAAEMPSGGMQRNHSNGSYAPAMTPPGRPERRALGQPWEDEIVRDGLRAALDVAELEVSPAAWQLVSRAGKARERWWIPSLRTWFAYGAVADLPGAAPYEVGDAPARAWSWKQPGGQEALPQYEGLDGEAAAERPLDWSDPLMIEPGLPYTDDYYIGLGVSGALWAAGKVGSFDPAVWAAPALVTWAGEHPWARMATRGWDCAGVDAPLLWWMEYRGWSFFAALATIGKIQ